MMLAHDFTQPRKGGITYGLDSGSLVGDTWVFEQVPTQYAVDPTGWWMSAKIDGVRAAWNPRKGFTSRSGKPFTIPKRFCGMTVPEGMSLDGELLIEGESAAFTSGVLHSHKKPSLEKLRYWVFDIIGFDAPYRDRYEWLDRHRTLNITTHVLPQVEIQSMDHAHDMYRDLVIGGAEGAVLRDPSAYYEPKRSWSLLKWKPTLTAEATVVGFEEGSGRLKGKLGNFVCELDGKQFRLSGKISDAFRAKYRFHKNGVSFDESDPELPHIGDLVTFEYMELTENGVPRQPVFLGVRRDL